MPETIYADQEVFETLNQMFPDGIPSADLQAATEQLFSLEDSAIAELMSDQPALKLNRKQKRQIDQWAKDLEIPDFFE